MPSLPPFYAHRFGRAYGPDSSRQALERAVSAPLAGAETDCCLTADGRLVLLHDAWLPKSVGVDGWAHERTADEITRGTLLTGTGEPSDQHPLTIEEVLTDPLLDGRLLQLEVKAFADPDLAARTAAAVCDAVVRSGRPGEHTEIISFWPSAAEVAATAGFASRVIVACAYAPDALAAWATERRVTGVILEAHYWSRPVVDTWRAAGLSIMSGVCNEAPLARRVLEFEPDAIATDRPHELAEELGAA